MRGIGQLSVSGEDEVKCIDSGDVLEGSVIAIVKQPVGGD
jgi:hypothetical protein